jgi:S-formylglutathione hydrolase FrmB
VALIHCDFFSEVLGVSASMYVILPQATSSQIGMAGKAFGHRHPTLYLLHGLSDDHTIWLRRTSIERYVAPLGLAVVMPAVQRSWYTDMKRGYRYWTFVSEELPAIARSFFPLSDQREDNYVAGLSMGGYGAFKLALRCPDKFAAAASLSGALDITRLHVSDSQEYANVFGSVEEARGSEDDLFHLAERLVRSLGPKPELYMCCGTEDFIYDMSTGFRDHARRIGLNVTYEEEKGAHDWAYWDYKIQRVLEWLPLPGKKQT